MIQNDIAEPARPVVRVGATVEEEVEPDTAVYAIEFFGSFASKEECAADYAEERRKVAEALAPFGLAEAPKLTGYWCSQRRTGKKGTLVGYSYRDRGSFEVPVKDVDAPAVLEALMACGARAEVGVWFGLADEHAVEQSLAARAVEESRKTAELLAGAAGARVSGVKSISYKSYSPAYSPMAFADAPDGASAQACFDPAPVEVEASVEVEWWLEELGA